MSLTSDKNKNTLQADQYTFLIISRSFLLRIRSISDRRWRDNQNTFCFRYFYFENRTVYEIMWKNIVEPSRPQMIIWHMRVACWITKATKTYTQAV